MAKRGKPSTDSTKPPPTKLPRSKGWRFSHQEEALISAFIAYHFAAAQAQVDAAVSSIEIGRQHGDQRMLAYGESGLVWSKHCCALLERLAAAVVQQQQYPRPGV
jgi:hypothetical protein